MINRKKITIFFILIFYLLSFSGLAWAAQEESDRIGRPYISFGYDENTTIKKILSVVEFTTNEVDSDEALSSIEKLEEDWEPGWEAVPMSRYWFDTTSNIVEKRFNIFPGVADESEIGSRIFNMTANAIFALSVFISRFSIELLLICFNSEIILNFGKDAIEVSKTIWEGDSQDKSIKNTLFMLAVVSAGFYLIYKLVKFRFSDIIRAILMTIALIALVFVYFTNAEKILETATGVTDTIGSAVFSIMPTSEHVPVEGPMDRGIAAFGGEAWSLLVVKPWAYGNLGTTNTDELTLTSAETSGLGNLKVDVSAAERVDQVLLGLPIGSADRHEAVNVFQDEDIEHGVHGQLVQTLGPGNSMQKILISILALVTTLVFTIFVIMIVFLILIASIKVLFCLVMAPFIAVAAVIPETGWNITLTWLKTILAGLFAKVFYGIYAGIVFLVSGVILVSGDDSEIPFIFKMILFCVILVFAMLFRKKFMNTTSGLIGINKEQQKTEGTANGVYSFAKWHIANKAVNSGAKALSKGNKHTKASNFYGKHGNFKNKTTTTSNNVNNEHSPPDQDNDNEFRDDTPDSDLPSGGGSPSGGTPPPGGNKPPGGISGPGSGGPTQPSDPPPPNTNDSGSSSGGGKQSSPNKRNRTSNNPPDRTVTYNEKRKVYVAPDGTEFPIRNEAEDYAYHKSFEGAIVYSDNDDDAPREKVLKVEKHKNSGLCNYTLKDLEVGDTKTVTTFLRDENVVKWGDPWGNSKNTTDKSKKQATDEFEKQENKNSTDQQNNQSGDGNYGTNTPSFNKDFKPK